MADDLGDGEYWLPPSFLADDGDSRFGSSLGTSSQLASPVESVTGSTEAESDEEDYMAGLTRRMARSAFLDDSPNYTGSAFRSPRNPKATQATVMAGSPQSTLCDLGFRGFGFEQASSHGSPNGPSPPPTCEVLYAAAGEVARMKTDGMKENNGCYDSRGFSGLVKKPSPVEKTNNINSPGLFFRPLAHLKLRQIEQLKHLQRMKQQQVQLDQGVCWGRQRQMAQSTGASNSSSSGKPNPLGLSSSAWPPLQPQQNPHQRHRQPTQTVGSGTRTMFLDSPLAARKGCAGTGVFFPRRACQPSETRWKPGCSTALLPARVVQALNLDVERMGADPRSIVGVGVGASGDVALRLGSSNGFQVVQEKHAAGANHHEIRLPSEWTY